MPPVTVAHLTAAPATLDMLTAILVETVAHGGSVGFMHPLAPLDAAAFWAASLAAAAQGDRVVFGAWDGPQLAGTVTLLLGLPPNQPHRAEIAKMMTRVSQRGRGVATALLHAAEAYAVHCARTLLVLDTAEEEGAAGLYERLGYSQAGRIPDYALKPHGGFTATRLYFKRVGPASA